MALALLDRRDSEQTSAGLILGRTVTIVLAVSVAIGIVLLPFWISLLHHPIDQTPIPHASRANYILSPQWGLNYFILPYGALILALPFIFIRGSSVVRLRPLLIGFWVAFLVGLGGTTPVGHWLLGRAFEVLTMERFSYWAGLLALPIVGLLIVKLIDRFRMWRLVDLAVLAVSTCALAVAWCTYRQQMRGTSNVNVWPIGSIAMVTTSTATSLSDSATSISRLAMMTDASSVDGEWNSGRMLPELTSLAAPALTSSKYFGKAGLDSLRAMLDHADRYGLKWVIVRRPLLRPAPVLCRLAPGRYLDDKTITVWSKDGVPPAMPVNAPQMPPHWQGVMWGTLPIRQQHSGHSRHPDPGKKAEGTPLGHPPLRRSRDAEDGLVNKGKALARRISGVATVGPDCHRDRVAGAIRGRLCRQRDVARFILNSRSGSPESGPGNPSPRLGKSV